MQHIRVPYLGHGAVGYGGYSASRVLIRGGAFCLFAEPFGSAESITYFFPFVKSFGGIFRYLFFLVWALAVESLGQITVMAEKLYLVFWPAGIS